MSKDVEEYESPPQATAKRPRRGLLPPELLEVVTPSFKVGALAGSLGLFTGVTAGIVRDASPALFGIASGIQWFTLGSTYWLSRTIALRTWSGDYPPDGWQKTKASTLAGGTAGMVGGLLRGPRNIIPGAIVFALVGGSGQAVANYVQQADFGRGERKSIFESKWSPLKKLTDAEYREYMEDKLLKLDTEIALIDDKIAELRASHETQNQTKGSDIS